MNDDIKDAAYPDLHSTNGNETAEQNNREGNGKKNGGCFSGCLIAGAIPILFIVTSYNCEKFTYDIPEVPLFVVLTLFLTVCIKLNYIKLKSRESLLFTSIIAAVFSFLILQLVVRLFVVMPNNLFTSEEYKDTALVVDRGASVYRKYGGKIFLKSENKGDYVFYVDSECEIYEGDTVVVVLADGLWGVPVLERVDTVFPRRQ